MGTQQRIKAIVPLTGWVFCASLALGSLSSWAADGIKVLEPGIKHFRLALWPPVSRFCISPSARPARPCGDRWLLDPACPAA